MRRHPNVNMPRLPVVTRPDSVQPLPRLDAKNVDDLHVFMSEKRRHQLRKVMLVVAILGVICGITLNAAWYFFAVAGGWMVLVFSQKSLSEAHPKRAFLHDDEADQRGYTYLSNYHNWWNSNRGFRPGE